MKASNNKSDLQDHSRALEMVPFDRPHTISYYSSIATMSLQTVSHVCWKRTCSLDASAFSAL